MIQARLQQLEAFFTEDFTLPQVVMAKPLDHVGLDIMASKRKVGGIKTQKHFYLPDTEIDAVIIFYTDVKKDNNGNYVLTNVGEDPTHIKEHKIYYNEDGSIYAENTSFKLVRNLKELKKARAKYAFTYLVDTAEKLGASSVIKSLFEHYKLAVDEWLDLGDATLFIDSINNETTPKILGILNSELPGNAPKKFIDGIMEQLTGIEWVSNA